MSPIEIFAVVASLVSVVLSVRAHVGTWPTGILGVAAYFVVFIGSRLYADAALQIVFFAQNVYGWWYWIHPREGKPEPPIGVMSMRHRVLGLLVMIAAAAAIGAGLRRWTDAAFPFTDATLSITSLVANWLLARKLIENWILWILADVGYVVVFWLKGLHLSAGLYVVFLGLCVAGVVEWMRDYRAQTLSPTITPLPAA